jgi:DNA polymerase-1
MIVGRAEFHQVLEKLEPPGQRGLDTETTGLSADDHLFSLIIADASESYYFNFHAYDDLDLEFTLPRVYLREFERVFDEERSTWFIANAKFDWRMLAKEGLTIRGRVHCDYAVERVLKNNYIGDSAYRLEGMALRRGHQKDDKVIEYVQKNKLYTIARMPGKKKQVKLMHFDRVPHEIIMPYGCKDATLHRVVGLDQLRQVEELDKNSNYPPISRVVENEIRLTRTCFKMEQRGILIDRERTQKALAYELGEVARLQGEFRLATGREYQDSNKLFTEVFDAIGEKYPTTDKGNPSFAADILEEMASPIAGIINRVRYHEKRAGTYYSSFLHYADRQGVIHPDMRQAGTETGRFSYRDPNLQNVPKEDEEEDQALPYHVRECFIPRPGHFFYAIDYQQMEYRLMLDLAGEKKLIDDVMAGADVHQATADLVGLTRKLAKNLNFAILYGAGVQKMAKMMGKTVKEAKELRFDYFAKLPKVHRFISQVVKSGESRGWIFNWLGRRSHIMDTRWAYVLPNHLIQGGCADVVKVAMNRLDDLGMPMLLQVHDELLFEFPLGQEDRVHQIVEVMENVYPAQNGMKLTTSIEHAYKSWGYRDKIKGIPGENKTS